MTPEYKALLAIIVGAIIVVWPGGLAAKARRRHDQRLAELRSGAAESYFEEQRALEAYPPPRREWPGRLLGLALVIMGLSRLVLGG